MIRIFNISILAALLVIVLSTGIENVEAGKSVTWSTTNIPLLGNNVDAPLVRYTTDTVSLNTSWVTTADSVVAPVIDQGSLATIVYKAKLIDVNTNNEITDNSSVLVGTQFRVVRDTSTQNTDISWNGTGAQWDSPYGRWVNNAGPLPLACKAADDIGLWANTFGTFTRYAMLNVDPPKVSVVNPTSNLSCSGNVCTVTGGGSIRVGLHFSDTTGRFYYRRYNHFSVNGKPTGCYANNVPLLDLGYFTNVCLGSTCLWDKFNQEETYTLPVSDKTIAFRLNGIATNNPPTPPTVIPNPLDGTTGISYTVAFTTTDPDAGDRVRFGVDWNNDGATDQLQPSSGFNASMRQTIARTWNTPGSYTYKVRAEDARGGMSGWTTAVANITLPAPSGLTATPNGTCGSGQITVSWNGVIGATSFTLRDGNTEIYTGSSNSFTHTGLTSASSHTYTVRANHASGNSVYSSTVTQNAPADCGLPNLSTLTAPNCSIAVDASTCTTPVSWIVLNPVSPKVVQNGATLATTPTGANVTSGPIHFGLDPQNTIIVTDTNGQLGAITPEGTCVLGALWDGSVCANANITSGVITTADPLTQNTDVTFDAPVTNTGTVSTGNAFRDEFSYQWGVTTGTWNSINIINSGVMNPTESRTDTSGSFTLVNTGTVHIQHCVDVTNTVVETDESNCTVTSFTITAPVAGTPEATLVAPSCDIAKGNSSCDTTVTWTSTDVPTPSIRREGTEFSNNPNSNAPQTIRYTDSPVTFTFSDGATDLATVDTGAGCASGLIWDGDSCELPATGTITANPPIIPRGGTTDITWTTTNATNCTVHGGVDTWTGTGDTKPSSPLTVDTIYVLECDGRPLDSVFVDVQGPDINATPRVVPKAGDPVTVSWNPWGVPGCVVNGGGLVNVDASVPGSRPNVIINGTMDFTITCSGVVEDRVKVELIGKGFET